MRPWTTLSKKDLNKTDGSIETNEEATASMHMLSKMDLNSAELETVRVFTNPTQVITANGEAQTNEEATVCVKDLDVHMTVQLLDDTPPVLSLGKRCENH